MGASKMTNISFSQRILCLLSCLLLSGLALANNHPSNNHPSAERYIVVLKTDAGSVANVAKDIAQRTNGQVGYIYEHVFKGFSISVPAPAVARISKNPNVAYIEPDRLISLSVQSVPTGIRRIFADDNVNLDIDGINDYQVDADVAVLDTGIDVQHPDLNIEGGANCLQTEGGGPPWRRTYYCDANVSFDDDHYHGTHVAGTIAAYDNDTGVVGVAPGARLWAVKVLDSQGSGYSSGIIKGIDWVIANGTIEVINMSLGGSGVSSAYKDAIDQAVNHGVVVVVSAGNKNDDANQYSPAFVPSAITVSSLADFDGEPGGQGAPTCDEDNNAGEDDTLSYFSNWGSAVDIAAPGSCIRSTVPQEYGYYGTLSGTSMAAPHVAGAAALLASGPTPPKNSSDVIALGQTLMNSGNYNWVDDSGDGIQEPLLDLTAMVPGDGGVNSGGGNVAPVANFSFSCTVLTCSFTDLSDDSDGSVVSWSWNFGDGASSSEQNPVHTYAAQGSYTVTLTATDNGDTSDTASQSVTVTDPSGAVLSVSRITPDTMVSGTTMQVTIAGDGFENGLSVTLGGGSGPTPTVSDIVVVDAQTINATIYAKAGGPPRNRYWNITVTNPDGSSDTLNRALTVTP